MQIIKPQSFLSTLRSTPFSIKLDKLYFPSKATIDVKIQLSTVSTFSSNVTEVTPSKIIINGSTITNGKVTYNFNNAPVEIQHSITDSGKRYLRVKVIQNGKSFLSNPILISSETGSGVITSKTVEKDFMPEFITFHDIYEIVGNTANLSLRVDVSNNALDSSPVWENATASYLSQQPYKFVNKTKTANKFAVKVKITVTKTNSDVSYNLYRMQFIAT